MELMNALPCAKQSILPVQYNELSAGNHGRELSQYNCGHPHGSLNNQLPDKQLNNKFILLYNESNGGQNQNLYIFNVIHTV